MADPQIMALRTVRTEKKQASDTLYHTIRKGTAIGLLPMGTRLREEEKAEEYMRRIVEAFLDIGGPRFPNQT